MIKSFEPEQTLPPIFEGAGETVDEVSVIPQAVKQLEKSLSKHPMTILALGPLTNIALLLKKRPDLAGRIKRIIAVAGQRPGQIFKVGDTPIMHFHDLNVRKDVEAFDIVLHSEVPAHLIPFEVGIQAVVTQSDLMRLNDSGKLDQWVGNQSLEWLDFWVGTLGATGFSPFDTMAVAYLAEPKFFSCDTIRAKIVRRRGLFVVRDTLEVSHSFSDGNVVTYCSQVAMSMRSSMTNFVSNPDRPQFLYVGRF